MSLACFLTVLVVECFLRMPFKTQLRDLNRVVGKSTWMMTSHHISDGWKEKVLLRYARDILQHTLYLALMLAGILLLLVLGAFVLDALIQPNPTTMHALSDPWVWLAMTIASLVYLFVRKRFVKH